MNGNVLKTETVEHGKSATAPEAPLVEGYTFDRWSDDFSNVTRNMYVQTMYNKDDIVKPSYDVKFETNGGTEVKSITQELGTIVSVKDINNKKTTKEGHTFAGWFTDEALTTAYAEVTMPKDGFTLYAKWDVNLFDVNFVDYNGKALKTEKVEFGKGATAPAEPTREGYTFANWNKDFSNVKNNMTVKATYTKNEVPVNPEPPVNPGDQGALVVERGITTPVVDNLPAPAVENVAQNDNIVVEQQENNETQEIDTENIGDDESPLSGRENGSRCILHWWILLIVAILTVIYTFDINKKKKQIRELEEEYLETV